MTHAVGPHRTTTRTAAVLASGLAHATLITAAFALARPGDGHVAWRASAAAAPTSNVLDPALDPDETGSPPPLEVAVEPEPVEPEPVEPPADPLAWPAEQMPVAPIAPATTPPDRAVAHVAVDWLAPVLSKGPRANEAEAAAVDASPVPGANEPPRYPWVAWRRGIEGTVVVELRIDASGAVTDASIARSSGNALLDEAAREQLATWRFTPARSAFGPTATTRRQDVVFRIGQVSLGAASASNPSRQY